MIALLIVLAAILFLLLFPFRIRAAAFADLLAVEADIDLSVFFFHLRRKLVFERGNFYLCTEDTATRLLFRNRPSPAGEALKKSLIFGGGWVITLFGHDDLAKAVGVSALLKAAGGALSGVLRAQKVPFFTLSRMNFSPDPVLRLQGSAVLTFQLWRFLAALIAELFTFRRTGRAGA